MDKNSLGVASQGGADPAIELANRIRKSRNSNNGGIYDQLAVDDRVLARITDGIYRRPSAALRELIFNAYDADATEVVIDTDAPKFNYVSVRDNGRGMDEDSLSNLFKHIGGSSKRTHKGVGLGTVNSQDPSLSYEGRKLIGKIGIGLFAVTHLTTHFRVITKKAGNDYRLIAEVTLKTWTEENLKHPPSDDGRNEYITGDFRITYEPATDISVQGTEVILMDLRKQTRDILRNKDKWDTFLESLEGDGTSIDTEKPYYHIGYVEDSSAGDPEDIYTIEPELPWDDDETSDNKFRQLFEGVVEVTRSRQKNPDIEEFLDSYLAMIWRLSLSAPLSYINKPPFSIKKNDGIDVYAITNKRRSQAVSIDLGDETISEHFSLDSTVQDPCGGFQVFVDGLELMRPVRLDGTLLGNRKRSRAKSPLMFVGKVKSSLGNMRADLSGGALEFEAYFYWNTLIVPKQNRGVLVRINDASGVLYDDRFMDYQVSELNRLSQITAEIFVIKGMDPALNIDRESFNVSHPHYQFLSNWVHLALRQVTNKLKELGKKGLEEEKELARNNSFNSLQKHLNSVWEKKADSMHQPPEILVSPVVNSQQDAMLRVDGAYVYHATKKKLEHSELPSFLSVNDQVKAVITVLAAYGLLENLSYDKQQSLFDDLLESLMPGVES